MTGPGDDSEPEDHQIAVVLHEPQLGGATMSLMRVVPLLEQRGWRFRFWVPGRGPAEQTLRTRGYEVTTSERLLRFSLSSFREAPGPTRRVRSTPAYLRSWRAWIRAQDVALVHANSLLALPELATRPRGGPPVVLHSHEVIPDGVKGAVAALLARRADIVVAVSEAAARALERKGIKASVVYEAVPQPGVAPRSRVNGPLVVGTLGTVSRRKGSDLFLAAARRVREQRHGIEFRMVGDLVVGGERSWAADVLQAAVQDGIEHRSGVDPFDEMADWDIFVLPSRMDPCPLAVFEAMAMCVPVVATGVGGIPEQVGDEAGLVVDSEDVEAIAAAVVQLAGSPQLRKSLGEAGSRRVERLFTLERQADALDQLYRRALAA